MMMPPLPSALVRNVISPVYRAVKNDNILPILAELEKNQWLTSDQVAGIQREKLLTLLRRAAVHAPYYRDLFRERGLRIDDTTVPSDLEALPYLTKEIITQNKERLVTEETGRKGYASSTGGSTGNTLYFYCDSDAALIRRANTTRQIRNLGVDIGDRELKLWGFGFDQSFKERFSSGLKNFFNNLRCLSSFDMSERAMREYASIERSFKPRLIVAYPSALALFAEFCLKESIKLYSPKAIISSGEKLYPHQRDVIEEVFQAPVYDRYGSREFADVACECPKREGLHIMNDLYVVEVIHESGRPAGNGEPGEIVVTDLSNHYMPFIRYRTGDIAVPTGHVCSCGRGLPMLERIEGRAFDMIKTPGGKSVGGFFWTHLSREVPGITSFQIEQNDIGGIAFRIVPGPDWKDEFMKTLEEKIKANCGGDFSVSFEIVEQIPLTASGKSKFIISNL
jgi:phenylacetate-CoA ligase